MLGEEVNFNAFVLLRGDLPEPMWKVFVFSVPYQVMIPRSFFLFHPCSISFCFRLHPSFSRVARRVRARLISPLFYHRNFYPSCHFALLHLLLQRASSFVSELKEVHALQAGYRNPTVIPVSAFLFQFPTSPTGNGHVSHKRE